MINRRHTHRALFYASLHQAAIGGICPALNQKQPFGNSQMNDRIQQIGSRDAMLEQVASRARQPSHRTPRLIPTQPANYDKLDPRPRNRSATEAVLCALIGQMAANLVATTHAIFKVNALILRKDGNSHANQLK